jgi:Skp family chaperone for outer membrane proteins
MKRKILLVLCLFGLALAGCFQPKALKVGYLNTDYLLAHWTKYKELSQSYVKDTQALIKSMSTTAKLKPEDKKKIKELEDKWKQKKEALFKDIKNSARIVALKNNLHFIIEHSDSRPTIEFGGSDVTSYILELLNEK